VTGTKAEPRALKKPARHPKRRKPDPIRAWTRRLERSRPGLANDTLAALAGMYGRPVWQRVYDPTSELILTVLSANSADINAEKAFDALCRHWPATAEVPREGAGSGFRPGWGGVGIEEAQADWATVADAPLDELIDVIRPGGLAPTKAPRIQAVLHRIFEERGDYSLEFLGDMAAADALAWLTSISGIGRKTASVVLLFSFGMPLMPVDRHVERVSKRIGLIPAKATVDQAHDMFLALFEPDQMYEGHVLQITHGRETCHAQRPACHRCAIAFRCRYFNPKAP